MKEKTGYTFYSVFVFMGKECQKPQEKQIGRLSKSLPQILGEAEDVIEKDWRKIRKIKEKKIYMRNGIKAILLSTSQKVCSN